MAWCVIPPWPDPVTGPNLNISVFGGDHPGGLDIQFGSPSTWAEIVNLLNDRDRENDNLWSINNGCICVEGPNLPASIKHDYEGGGVINFAEIEKAEVDPEIQACLDCFEQLFGCSFLDMIPADMPLTKASIVAAIQAGLTPGEGEPEPTSVTATIIGSVLGLPGAFIPGTSTIPDELSPAVNPSCEADDFGWLVVDLNLPETTQLPTTAATTYTVIDAAAGMGTVYIVDKSTDTVLGQSYPPGAGGQGNTTAVPFDHTISYTIPAGASPEDVCMVFNAFGQAGAWEGSCDEIGPGETIVTVTPNPCASAIACFEEMFGCAIEDMIDFPPTPEIPEIPEPVALATVLPLPDNDVDNQLRLGRIGTSTEAARADHVHPVRVQANPGDPVLTLAGDASGSITSGPLILDRHPEEESYSYKYRTRVAQEPGNNWSFLQVPNIAGFQRPQLTGIGTYRTGSTAVQDDDVSDNGLTGAGPRGPYMGKEAHEWSSTQRIYLGYFRRDNPVVTWVEFFSKYVRLP